METKSAEQMREDLARKRARIAQNGAQPATAENTRQIVPRETRRVEKGHKLPNSPEAEQGVLGSMLSDPRVIPKVSRTVSKEFFFNASCRTCFVRLIEHSLNTPKLDISTFTLFLEEVGDLAKVGGPAFITSLFTGIGGSASNLEYYVETLVSKHQRRELFLSHSTIAQRALDESEELGTLLDRAQSDVERVTSLGKPQARLPELRDLSTMLGESRPPAPPELVNTVLHQGSKLIVGGTSKGRKTYSLIDLAVSVATGHSWWGFDCAKGRVCYINFEIQESFFCGRVETICEKKGVTLEPGMLMGWNLRGHGEGIENMVAELMGGLRRRQFVLIIFDPIYKALGDRDENKAGDVASMLNELEKIAVQTGAAIAFGAHYSKGNQSAKESIDRIGGSGVFARDPDSILTMTAHEEEDAFTVEATLRNFRPLDPFVVKWEWPLFQRATDLDPENLKQPRKGNSGQFQARYTKDMLLEELSILEGVKPPTLKKLMDERHGMSKTHFYRFAQQLHAEGLIVEKDGLWFKGSKKS